MHKIHDMDSAQIASEYINKTNRHIFLTGKAGTGKTTFLHKIVKNTHKNTVVAAPTGIAAINAGGVTLHSLFHLPFGVFIPEKNWKPSSQINFKTVTPTSLINDLQMNGTKRKLLRQMELLVIDEVSMLRADLLDAIDTVLRFVRKNHRVPFGGVQVLFIGDMLQLPPVTREDEAYFLSQFYKSSYFFDAHALQQIKPLYIELETVYRQSDPTFLRLLNHLRDEEMEWDDFELLQSRVVPGFRPQTGDGYIHLVTHNAKADQLNKQSLELLPERSFKYSASIEADFPEHLFPLDYVLELKVGAQVMFIKNDISTDRKYFNGKIGTIASLTSEEIKVQFADGSAPVLVEKYLWENKRYTLNEETNLIEEKVLGSFSHYPLKLAWAITIHKSQGLTFDKAIVDVNGAFAPGQMYVAFSRLRSLEGLVLTSPLRPNNVRQDQVLLGFTEQKTNYKSLIQHLESDSESYFQQFVFEAFDFAALQKSANDHVRSYEMDVLRSEKQKYLPWAVQWRNQLEDLKVIADRFPPHIHKIIQESADSPLSKIHERVASAKKYFEPLFAELIKQIKAHISEVQKIKKVKGYLEELKELERQCFKQWQSIQRAEALLNAAITNGNFDKEHILDIQALDERQKESTATKGESKKGKTEKEPKGQTKQHTFQLFKDGKSVEEIARERQMAVSTIEGHLAHFIELGDLDVFELLSPEKFKAIEKVVKQSESTLYGPIKAKLGDDFSYSEIRFAMAKITKDL